MIYLYVGDDRKNQVNSIDGQWDIILHTLPEKRLPMGKLFDILLEGQFSLGSDGKTYSLRSDDGEWRKSISIFKVVDGEENTLLQAFFGN